MSILEKEFKLPLNLSIFLASNIILSAMRNLLLTLSIVLASAGLYGQEEKADSTTSGQILYEQTVNVHANMTGRAAQWKSYAPEFMVTQYKVLYTPEVFTYQMEEDLERELSEKEQNMRKWMGNPDDRFYGEIESRERIQEKTFLNKKFLIIGDWQDYEWKPTGEFEDIQGYPCMKAVHEDTAGNITAWFSTDIPLPVGPGEINGLPGVILKVDIPGQHTVIEVKEITFREVSEDEIEKPRKGKKVTDEEFKEIVSAKMKEMRENGGGWGMH